MQTPALLRSAPAPFEIVDNDRGGRTADSGAHKLHLLDADGRVFRRRAFKGVGGEPYQVEWAVAELAGVRVYFDGTDVVVTRADITP